MRERLYCGNGDDIKENERCSYKEEVSLVFIFEIWAISMF